MRALALRQEKKEMYSCFRVMLLFQLQFAAAVEFSACDGSKDHLHLQRLSLKPEKPQPGGRACLSFELAPDAAIREGTMIRLSYPSYGKRVGDSYPLCGVKGVECPTAPLANVSAKLCGDLPLSAMLHAGERLRVGMSATDESGAPVACWNAYVFVNVAPAFDADVEEVATSSHSRLRRALSEARGMASEDERAAHVRPLLRQVFEAAPHWADAYEQWRNVHTTKRSLQATTAATGEATTGEADGESLLARAESFATFRENVMRAHHAGRPVSLDARSDMPADSRRTLAHFA